VTGHLAISPTARGGENNTHPPPRGRQPPRPRRTELYGRLQQDPPTELGGEAVVRSRDDDGFKYYLKDGSWVLIRFSGTEPLIRVYSEAPSKERVDKLLAALEDRLGLRQHA